MLLEANAPIALAIPEAGVSIGSITPHEKHRCWWSLVERFSQFDKEARLGFLDRIAGQLRLPENWRERFIQEPTLAARFLTLNRAGLRQLAAAGMSLGAHSLSHPILSRAAEELAWREISESRAVLEKAFGQTMWAFAYPFGNAATVTQRDLRLAERAGYCCALTNTGGGLGAKIDRFAIPRVHVTADMNLPEFEAYIAGFYRTLRSRLGGARMEVVGA